MSRAAPQVDAVRIDEVVVVIPARDEQERIGACLDALQTAAAHPSLAGVEIHILVVLDGCTDGTATICAARGISTVRVAGAGGDVGRARALGIVTALQDWTGAATGWIATTDADSVVAPDWLAEQVRLARSGADAVLGVIDVRAPSAAFSTLYRNAAPGDAGPHPHVHGASMGLSPRAYLRVGGFQQAPVGEDQALADRLEDAPELRVVRSTAVRVLTSDRRVSRVRGGFADVLLALDRGAPIPGR